MAKGTWTMACLMWAASVVGASEPSPINDRGFMIPLHVQESRRADIRQVILYMSRDGESWEQAGAVTPDKDGFSFNAPSDGLYLFKLQVEGVDGSKAPADITKAPVSQKILVDTLAPQLRILDGERQGENVVVRWEAREENPNWATLVLEYHMAEMPADAWTPVPIAKPALKGEATFRPSGPGALTLRMNLSDLAKNAAPPATFEVPAAPAGNNIAKEVSTDFNSAGSKPLPMQPIPQAKNPDNGWTPTPVRPVSTSPMPRRDPGDFGDPIRTPVRTQPDPVDPSGRGPGTKWDTVHPRAYATGTGTQVVASSSPKEAREATNQDQDPPRTNPNRGSMPRLQIVNNRQVTLQYEAKVGPSGVGAVELYVTRDDGQKWERLTVDQGGNSPASEDSHNPSVALRRSLTVDLPGEGRFGFYLVVKSGVGRGKPAPKDGDAPQMLVEVDETAPEANLYAPEADPKQHDALILRWTASDRNLAAKPITLEWAERPTGPWEKIASKIPNSPGQFTWKISAQIPPKVYLRLTVEDTAGNVAKAETPEPITVDLYEPEAQFIGLSSGNGR